LRNYPKAFIDAKEKEIFPYKGSNFSYPVLEKDGYYLRRLDNGTILGLKEREENLTTPYYKIQITSVLFDNKQEKCLGMFSENFFLHVENIMKIEREGEMKRKSEYDRDFPELGSNRNGKGNGNGK
jgi:hypothetical protein